MADAGARGANSHAAAAVPAGLAHHDIPRAGSPGTQSARGALAADPDAVPDLVYEGGAEHVFDTRAQLELKDAAKIGGDTGTISFWLQPQWQAHSQDDATFVQLGDSGMQLVKNVDYLRFEFTDGAGVERGVGTDISTWAPGDWRQVTASWSGGTLSLYVDGKLVSENRFPEPPQFSEETRLYVGSLFPGGSPIAPAQLSYLTVTNRPVSGGEVQDAFRNPPPPPSAQR